MAQLRVLTQCIRKMRGISQSILAQASDGKLYVVKFSDNPQGSHIPFNEAMGNELYSAAWLTVPRWIQVFAGYQFIEQNPSCWFDTPDGLVKPRQSLCFASRYLGASEQNIFQILPGPYFVRVNRKLDFWLAWALDICAFHVDGRQALFLEDANGRYNAVFIDHGHMFAGPNGDQTAKSVAPRYFDPRIYEPMNALEQKQVLQRIGSIDIEKLWRRAGSLPDSWKTPLAMNKFTECLNKLANSAIVRDILDSITETHDASCRKRSEERKLNKRDVCGVLRDQIPLPRWLNGSPRYGAKSYYSFRAQK